MATKVSADSFGPASLLCSAASVVCSLSLWLGLVLSRFPGAPGLDFSAARWLQIQGVGVVLALVACVLNFERRLWIPAIIFALCNSLLVMFVMWS